MTLYRKTSLDNRGDKPHPDAFWSDKYGWLEEAEPCEHGSYTRHIDKDEIITDNLYPEIPWCPGAGLEDE